MNSAKTILHTELNKVEKKLSIEEAELEATILVVAKHENQIQYYKNTIAELRDALEALGEVF